MMKRSRLIVLAALLVLSLSAAGVHAQNAAPQAAPSDAGFTYQGQLKKGGQLYNGTCDFQFGLYDVASGGNQVGTLLTQNGVSVAAGVFAVKLDFGANAFTGDARWLQVAVKCPGDEGFVIFNTRQELTPTPYAISLVPGAVVRSTQPDQPGIVGESSGHDGVIGRTTRDGYAGVTGQNTSAAGGNGVFGYNKAPNGNGVLGLSDQGTGVTGIARVDDHAAVFGSNEAGGAGVLGRGERGDGVVGEARQDNKSGVFGNNLAGGAGIFGSSVRGDGVFGVANVDNKSGVAGINNAGGPGVFGYSKSGYAGRFDGKVIVKTLEIAGGGDLAEPFDVQNTANGVPQPGTVVCIDSAQPGKLVVCANAYDRTVAGVISGAGGVQPGMVMRQDGSAANGQHPVALTGRVYVWADATQQPIHPGDLLTTAATPGHAAKATDYAKAQGAIIGKAMGSLEQGKGLVLVLVGLN